MQAATRTVRLVDTPPAPASAAAMEARARRLWPHSEYNQREWLRAVSVVRSTSAGWHLDKTIGRRV